MSETDEIIEKTKAWAHENPTLTGAAAGAAVGSFLPGVGTITGAIVGGLIGHLAGRDRRQNVLPTPRLGTPTQPTTWGDGIKDE